MSEQQSSAVSAREAALEAAARDFVGKVDRSEAYSTRSYALFKAALAVPADDAAPQAAPSDIERAFQDACDEAGCAYDNEALLEAIHALKERCQAVSAKDNTND